MFFGVSFSSRTLILPPPFCPGKKIEGIGGNLRQIDFRPVLPIDLAFTIHPVTITSIQDLLARNSNPMYNLGDVLVWLSYVSWNLRRWSVAAGAVKGQPFGNEASQPAA